VVVVLVVVLRVLAVLGIHLAQVHHKEIMAVQEALMELRVRAAAVAALARLVEMPLGVLVELLATGVTVQPQA
jgi:hypothetical protein